jgi:transposase
MSMKPHGIEPIPEETRVLAAAWCPKGSTIMRLRDALGPIYHDIDFAALFPRRGRPAEAPWRLALITVLQAMEDLTDRQAAEMVTLRVDWRYALSLPATEVEFDFTALSRFRERLSKHDIAELILEPILKVCRREGWLMPGGQQRTDSTHVLAAVHAFACEERVGEALRAALNTLAALVPEWLLAIAPEHWFERYVDRIDLQRMTKNPNERAALRDQMGADAWRLLQALDTPLLPDEVKQHPTIETLALMWQQHFEWCEGQVCWRKDGPAVKGEALIASPYDTQVRWSRKRSLCWLGYKTHLTETCSRQSEALRLIVHVETTFSTVQDKQVLAKVLQECRERQQPCAEQLVDQGYVTGELLVQQRALHTEVLGPVPPVQGWQCTVPDGITAEAFEIDGQKKVATCPQGKQSISYYERLSSKGQPVQQFRFATKDCQACPLRERCCRGQRGRILSLTPQEQNEALRQRRAEQQTVEWKRRYALRAGVEASVSQAVRTTSFRRTRYRGLDKTHGQEVTIAAGINLKRIDAHLKRQQRGSTNSVNASARPPTPFKRLQMLKEAN